MVNKICLDYMEFTYLTNIFQIENVIGFPEINPTNETMEENTIRSSLYHKKYLIEIENNEIAVNKSLLLPFNILRDCDSAFITKKVNKENVICNLVFYFSGDSILLVEQKNKNYEFVWIPFLPLAVGSLANHIDKYKSGDSNYFKKIPVAQLENIEILDENDSYLNSVWTFSGWNKSAKEDNCFFMVWETANDHFLLDYKNSDIVVTKPSRENLINICTSRMSVMHGEAIKKRGII